MRREVVRQRPDGTEQVRWKNPVNGRFVTAPDGSAAPKAAAKAGPPVPYGGGPAANPQDDARAAVAAPLGPDVRQAHLYPPPDVGLPRPTSLLEEREAVLLAGCRHRKNRDPPRPEALCCARIH